MRSLGVLMFGLWPVILLAQPIHSKSQQPTDSIKTYNLQEVVVSTEAVDGEIAAKNNTAATENVDHYLRQLHGVDLVSRGMYAAEPVFRGMSGDRAPVTINNMKIFGACTDKMDPVSSYVSVNNLQSISVVKDAGSGTAMNATSGVIAFKTKKPVFSAIKSWQGQAGAGYKSVNNELSGHFSTAYNSSKWAMRLNGTYRNAGNYVAGGGQEIDFSQYAKSNVAFSSSYLLQEDALLSIEYIFDLATNVGYPALPMDVSTARGNIYSVSYNKYFSHGQLEAKLYGNNILHEMDDSERVVVMHMDMPGWSDTYGAYLTWTADAGKNTLTTTVDYYLNQARAEMTMYPAGEIPMYMLTWPDVQKNAVALSASNKRQLSDGTALTTSLRLEVGTNRIKDEFGIKQLQAIGITGVTGNDFVLPAVTVGLTTKAGEFSQWNMMIAYSQRQASVSEGFGYYLFNIQDNYDYIGDPRLAPETSLKLEGGYAFDGDKLQFNFQGFGYYLPDYIIGEIREGYSPMTIGASGVKFYINLPYAYMYGFEAGLSWQITTPLIFTSQAQFTQGYDEAGLPLPMVPPLKNLTRVAYKKSDWRAGIELRSALAQKNPRTEFGETYTPGYTMLNLDIGYTFSFSKTTVRLMAKGENLLDQYYWDHLDFNTIPKPGRSFNFSVMVGW